ncbi:hypothetical protein DRO31_07935 [Candidatus Bathyarchaeota archaeon]|nr:MAG: hypothetical protein DRO31_07935 [Candidatus Bathyarchaeota archaeon]
MKLAVIQAAPKIRVYVREVDPLKQGLNPLGGAYYWGTTTTNVDFNVNIKVDIKNPSETYIPKASQGFTRWIS